MADTDRDEDEGDAGEKQHRVMSAGLSTDIYEKLQRAAKRESRSVATYVALLIEKALKKKKV